MKTVLLKDIVIPAGTIFDTAPRTTERVGEGHVEATFGLSKDTYGTIGYSFDGEILRGWFAELRCPHKGRPDCTPAQPDTEEEGGKAGENGVD